MKFSKKTERVGLVFSPEEVREIDNWRRTKQEIPSRSEAIRQLVQKGLSAEKKEKLA